MTTEGLVDAMKGLVPLTDKARHNSYQTDQADQADQADQHMKGLADAMKGLVPLTDKARHNSDLTHQADQADQTDRHTHHTIRAAEGRGWRCGDINTQRMSNLSNLERKESDGQRYPKRA